MRDGEKKGQEERNTSRRAMKGPTLGEWAFYWKIPSKTPLTPMSCHVKVNPGTRSQIWEVVNGNLVSRAAQTS